MFETLKSTSTAISRAVTPSILAGVVMLAALLAQPAHAQTYQVLHYFAGGADGAFPNGLAIDRSGNFYGTTGGPGNCLSGPCGGVFKLSHSGSGWVLNSLYHFQGGNNDGKWVQSGVTIARDGSLYGTTIAGGGGPCSLGSIPGCGTVYRLQPPPNRCSSISCPWLETVIHKFADSDIWYSYSEVAFDAAGNLYGTAVGGSTNPGGVFKMTSGQGGWTFNTLFTFNRSDGAGPYGTVLLDPAGNIFGTTDQGGPSNYGTAYELSPSGSGWTFTNLYNFSTQNNNGAFPNAGLIRDAAGNLYGPTTFGGSTGGGTVYELSPVGGGYSISVLYGQFPDLYGEGGGAQSKLVMDAAGNLYGTTSWGGANLAGMVFRLSPGAGGWTFTDLHDFNYNDGSNPSGDIVFDAGGNLYGTTQSGGTGCSGGGCGVVWEITP